MTVTGIVKEARSASVGEIVRVSGVELDQEGFAESRFGKDRRLEEVARMLRSSEIPIVKMLEQPEAR
jgi:anaphase-promoting complex subunit 1